MEVFVIIVTYNGLKWYDRCFGSLQSSEIPVKVVAIDNASSDGSCETIRQRFPEVVLLKQDKNLGFGQANNLGMRYALDHGADFVFLLNQDAWIEPDTLKKLIQIHQDHPEYGILSPIHLTADKQHVEPLLLERIADYKTTDSTLINDLYLGTVKEVYDTKYVNAAAWLLPRKTIETIGGFDPIFFHYGEDDNYLNRVLYHGMRIGICPQTSIVHDARLERPLYDSREHEILMLIDYTNPNVEHRVEKDMKRHWRKAVTSLLRGRKSAYRSHLVDYQLLRKYGQAIKTSVNTNRQIGSHWL
jgi:GT2 family glycosyltransferase